MLDFLIPASLAHFPAECEALLCRLQSSQDRILANGEKFQSIGVPEITNGASVMTLV